MTRALILTFKRENTSQELEETVPSSQAVLKHVGKRRLLHVQGERPTRKHPRLE